MMMTPLSSNPPGMWPVFISIYLSKNKSLLSRVHLLNSQSFVLFNSVVMLVTFWFSCEDFLCSVGHTLYVWLYVLYLYSVPYG